MKIMQMILAMDAGGTHTRAAALDPEGRVLGTGRADSGNPTSSGIDGAVAGIGAAAELALAASGARVGDRSSALIALAGTNSPAFRAQLIARLSELGFGTNVTIEADLLGTYFSGTPDPNGYALIAGTGAVAARVSGGRIEQLSGGTGWLIGDAGSGFWIGHQVVRAVAAALDGQRPATALTGMLLEKLGLGVTAELENGRPLMLVQLMSELYSLRPVEMSQFAPLAFAASTDPVARSIVDSAVTQLVDLLAVVLDSQRPGPIVLGGSVLKQGILGPGSGDLAREFTERLVTLAPDARQIVVSDGLTGACVLSLRYAGIQVGPELFCSLRAQLDTERM
jgi:glucosamine kinase